MIKYTQKIIFSIPKSFAVKHTPILDFAGETSTIITDDIQQFVTNDILTIKDCVGEMVWNSGDPNKKYYFVKGTNINGIVEDGGIEITISDNIKTEEI